MHTHERSVPQLQAFPVRYEAGPDAVQSASYAETSLRAESLLGTAAPGLNGAQGRDRTTDTAIFSRMLYQLSYLGMPQRVPFGHGGRAVYSGVGPPCLPIPASCGSHETPRNQ